ncbi:putative phospholipid ABC transporter-binding protein MlaD [invertebrate metagenome]|uniref:Putative phospholipid ABC transporter-binding protein MlaD n=1 Tax=invertebrate metagenome TaxID=1711999 RepID=A0A2H9TCD5_9ZZZZ
MRMRTVEISVGAFMLAGVLALAALALQVSGLSINESKDTYTLYALFDNIGSLKQRAKVTIAGVPVGRVTHVELDQHTFAAKVEMSVDSQINQIPIDSTASIVTAGLLGEKYISISIGGDEENLKPGQRIEDTQSAVVLEDLIGKVIMAFVNKKGAD